MPATKKKFNARFPPGRIKKIMQTDDEIGKVAAAVPVLVSKAVEIFMESLVSKAGDEAASRKARTMSAAHLRSCIMKEKQFDFLKDLVANVQTADDDAGESQDGGSCPRRAKRRRSTGSMSSRRTPSMSHTSEPPSSGDEKEEDDEDVPAPQADFRPMPSVLSGESGAPVQPMPFSMAGLAPASAGGEMDDDYDC